jgi:FkbM family methyltransferase
LGRILQLRRKAMKLWSLRDHARFRRALRFGVAASIEHRHIVARESFATLIDAGANRGQFSLLVSALKPGCRIHAFEPLTAAADTFAAVMADLPNVALHRVALGEAAGLMPMTVGTKSDTSSLRKFARVGELFAEAIPAGESPVAVRRLDDLLSPADLIGPALLKIDVQGFEREVIAGATRLLPLIDLIYVEVSFVEMYHGQTLFPELNRYLESLGYEAARIGDASGGTGEPGCYGDILYRRVQA